MPNNDRKKRRREIGREIEATRHEINALKEVPDSPEKLARIEELSEKLTRLNKSYMDLV